MLTTLLKIFLKELFLALVQNLKLITRIRGRRLQINLGMMVNAKLNSGILNGVVTLCQIFHGRNTAMRYTVHFKKKNIEILNQML